MPEIRQNMATKEWVIIATERSRRPSDFFKSDRAPSHTLPAHLDDCPFCVGNEQDTLEERLRLPAEGPWRLRVFPNRYPALQSDGARVQCMDGIRRKLSGVGFHEVIVDSPWHNAPYAHQTPEEIHLSLYALQHRNQFLIQDPRIEHIVNYRNHGPQAGASLQHPHSQLLGLPMIPNDMRRRIEETRHAIDSDGACPYCAMLDMELAEETRLVATNRHFVAFVPYAAFSPFHLWIVPRLHSPTFLNQNADVMRSLAEILRTVSGKLYSALGDPAYNMLYRSAPKRDLGSTYLHWYVSIVPRVTRAAGFELGTGMYINPLPPEQAAQILRDTDPGPVPDRPLPPKLADRLVRPGLAAAPE